MGEGQKQEFQNCRLTGFCGSHFKGSRVTSDGGLMLVRELDERFGIWRTHRTAPDRILGATMHGCPLLIC